MRLWFPRAWGELYAPASAFYEGDARAYLNYAAHLVKGIPFDNGIPFHPPGWPFVLSLFFRLEGFNPLAGVPADQAAIKAFVAVLSGLSVGLTTFVAGRFCGRGAMLAIPLLGIVNFAHVVQGSVPNADALYGLLMVAAVLLAWRWTTDSTSPLGPPRAGLEPGGAPAVQQSTGLAGILGLVSGFATLVRPEFAVCALLFGLAFVRIARRRWSELITYAFGFALTLTPTTVWHWQSISTFNETRADRLPGRLPRFAPVTSYGAFNFANANHERAPGGFNFDAPALRPQTANEEKQFDEGYLDLALPSVYNVYVHGYGIGLWWMIDHPGAALALVGRKAVITSGVFAHGYLQTNLGSSADGVRRPVDEADPSARWLWPVHVGLVLWGAWLLARRGGSEGQRLRWMIFSPLASLAASSLLFYGYVRLGAAYLPVFWILQAIAITAIAGRVPLPRFARARSGLLVLAFGIILLVAEAIGLTVRHAVVLEGATAPGGSLVQDATVVIKSR
ncbi:MAG: hypothetical protein HYS05_19710 [Acidobacteria bacterium]|nr:hypothetical protein [Acidobacteriota bacterium]